MDPLPDYNSNTAYFRSETPLTHRSTAVNGGAQTPRESLDNLPIASRFLSTPTNEDQPSSSNAPSSSTTRLAARKRSNLTARRPGASTPVIPDSDERDTTDYNSAEEDDDDDLGRGSAPGANRVPRRVSHSPYGFNSPAPAPAPRPSTNYHGPGGGGLLGNLNLNVGGGGGGKSVPFPGDKGAANGTRSHQSLPPPPRSGQPGRVSTSSLVGQLGVPHTAQNSTRAQGSNQQSRSGSSATNRLAKRMFGGSNNNSSVVVNGGGGNGRKDSGESHHSTVTLPQNAGSGRPTPAAGAGPSLAPHLLPEDLRKCLEVLEGGILNGHVTLSDGLRKRYEEQYPLVRSLADVFVSNVSLSVLCFGLCFGFGEVGQLTYEFASFVRFQSHILRGYATYVLHLERALEQVDDALSVVSLAKKPKKQDVADWIHVSKVLRVRYFSHYHLHNLLRNLTLRFNG